ncbi:hypothetical protein CAEBREN_10203 [Caenorhabditis brenneri]|uniref:Uncharacterized protein n=1 Tax=Caenorhabditis brenneri TaxID=135651 RepID=G0N196_CAEBE|nr:hypothetical protein CAEBREN_10203 [Caenorhabditis brenneri]
MNLSGLEHSSFTDFHNARAAAAAAPTTFHWGYMAAAGVVIGIGIGGCCLYMFCTYRKEKRKVGDMGQPLIPLNPLNPANAQEPVVPNYGAVPPPQN